MSVASVAGNAASSATSSVASSASSSVASNAASKATNVGNAMPSSGLPSSGLPSSGLPSTGLPTAKPASPSGTPSSKPNVDSPSESHSSSHDINSGTPNSNSGEPPKGDKDVDSEQNESNSTDNNTLDGENNSENNSEKNNQQAADDGKYHAKDNQELEPGQKLDENGNVVDTGNKKFTKALAVGAATYFGGVKGGETANALTKSEAGNKLTGAVGDALDKSAVGKITEDLGDSGAADAITDAADTVSAAKSGDIKNTVKSGTSTLKNLGKTVKHYAVHIALASLTVLGPLIMVCVVIGAVCGPVLGGFMDVTSAFGEFVDDVGDFFTGENDITGTAGGKNLEVVIKDADQMVGEIPNYNLLPEPQKSIVTAAAAGIASGKPYRYGGKPTGPGLDGIPASGIDCSGFVAWAIWTGTGKRPGAQSTSTIASSIGTLFEEISASELQPGDIGLKHKGSGSNHTGIYAGNGMWLHAASTNTGLVRSRYSNFTIFLRYKG